MELKLKKGEERNQNRQCLNRTFMELKQDIVGT